MLPSSLLTMTVSPAAAVLALLLLSSALSTSCAAVSITLTPIVVSLRLSNATAASTSTSTSTSTSASWSSADFSAISAAAKQYIDGHGLLESALGFPRDDGLQYDGVHFTAADAERRRRFLRAKSSQDEIDVTLSGTVAFSSSSESHSTVLPTAEGLTDVVLALFRNGQTLFVKTIVSVAAANQKEGAPSEWMTRVTGYDVRRTASQQPPPKNVAVSPVRSADDASPAKSAAVVQVYGINLFILVGVAGAAVSFLLLVAGLCYAKRVHGADDDKKKTRKKKKKTKHAHFSPSQTRRQGKQKHTDSPPILRNHSQTTTNNSPSSSPSHDLRRDDAYPRDGDDDDDDESRADFLMARAALNNSHSAIRPSRAGGNASVVSSSCADDNMSYAFSVEGESVLGGAGTAATAAGSKAVVAGDAAIGAGGIAAFRSANGGVFRWNEDKTKMVYIPAPSNHNAHNVNTQNGFIYDERLKKWVLAQKNVSFQGTENDTDSSLLTTPPRPLHRVRTDDSCVTGFTEFSYDDVAATHRDLLRVPSTPHDEGVEVMADDYDDVSEFAPNTNVERFLMDDESIMGGSVSDGFNDSDTVTVPPPPPPMPPPPLPMPESTGERTASPNDSLVSMNTEEPGIIQRVPSVHEDKPFDEDIPFDERPKRQSSNAKAAPGGDNPRRSAATKEDDASESCGSADSSRVLNDLNKLSKFMTERKRSSKGSMTRSDSGGSHPRTRSSRN